MAIDDQIIDEKPKISTLLSGKVNKYEYHAGEKMLPSNEKQVVEKTQFNYSQFEKAFENKRKQLKNKKINKSNQL